VTKLENPIAGQRLVEQFSTETNTEHGKRSTLLNAITEQRLRQDTAAWADEEGGVFQSKGDPEDPITNPNSVTDTNT
jgi:hypothetical protein